MKVLALVDPKDLRYVLTCERCANRRDKRINLMVMYFNNIKDAIAWALYVRYKKSYWQRGYSSCQCVKNQISMVERQKFYKKGVAA